MNPHLISFKAPCQPLELVFLRAGRSAIQTAKPALEDDAAAVHRQFEGMKDTEAALQVGGGGAAASWGPARQGCSTSSS